MNFQGGNPPGSPPSTDFGYSQMAAREYIRAYQSNIKRSEIFTIGGAPFTPDLNLTTWLNDVPSRLATIDHTADPIHFAITPTQFPELPPPAVRVVADYVLEATDRYYLLNTKQGCVDPKARNFNVEANFGDSTYMYYDNSISNVDMVFGGLCQTCHQSGRENLCKDRKIQQVNPQTEGYSYPDGYTAVSLYNGRDSYRGHGCIYIHLTIVLAIDGDSNTTNGQVAVTGQQEYIIKYIKLYSCWAARVLYSSVFILCMHTCTFIILLCIN